MEQLTTAAPSLTKDQVFVPLTRLELETLVSSAFTEKKADTTSEKYSYASTIQLVDDLAKLGWQPIRAIQRTVKNQKFAGFQLHTITLRNPEMAILNEAGEVEAYVEITISNSHDGMSSLKITISLFRVACSNGLTIQSENFGSERIIHKGFHFDQLRELVEKLTSRIPDLVTRVKTMQERILTPDEITDFTKRAAAIREKYSQGTKVEVNVEELNTPIRVEDKGENLWVVYNRIQEKLLNGGFKNEANGRMAKKIKFLDKILWINKDLFELTSNYLPINKEKISAN